MRWVVLLLLLTLAGSASAQLMTGVSIPNTGGGAPTPPAGCTGAIDLGTGCVQPMLGGL